MSKDEEFEELIETMLPAVEQQMSSSETGYVKKAYERLVSQKDIDDGEARYLIACCLAICSDAMLRSGKEFDHKGYRAMLAKLPELPE